MKITKETKLGEIIPEGYDIKSCTERILSNIYPFICIDLVKQPSMYELKGFIAEPIKDQGFSSKDEAEIEAYKMGFHIGDRLYSKKYKTFSGTAKEFFFEFDNETPCARYSKGEWDRLEDVYHSKLMLGKYSVTIENGFVKCKDGIVAIPEWINWATSLKNIKTYAIVNNSITLILGDYETIYKHAYKTIKVGCIDNATLKQVRKITKAIKNLNK